MLRVTLISLLKRGNRAYETWEEEEEYCPGVPALPVVSGYKYEQVCNQNYDHDNGSNGKANLFRDNRPITIEFDPTKYLIMRKI